MNEQPLLNTYIPRDPATLIDFDIIGGDIKNWADYNWPRSKQAPHFGVCEEIGELTHCYLKRIQGIREGETQEQYEAAVADALADAMIYVLHWGAQYGHRLSFNTRAYINAPTGALIACAHQSSGTFLERFLLDSTSIAARMMLNQTVDILNEIALQHNLALFTITRDTWLRVRTRDWRQFPVDGKTQWKVVATTGRP